jgi:hypothetical protein
MQPGETAMTESAVRVIVFEAFEKYEKETALPRHNENLGNFTKVFAAMNKAIGSINALKWFVGLIVGGPGIVMVVIELLRFARGH